MTSTPKNDLEFVQLKAVALAVSNAERAKRRGEPIAKDSTDQFDKCVGVKEATVLVGSRGHKAFDRVGVRLVYLQGSYEVIAARLAARRHEYMPASLLKSQFEALEEPGPDEHPIVVSVELTPPEIVEAITGALAPS